jgi:hypothetical protein
MLSTLAFHSLRKPTIPRRGWVMMMSTKGAVRRDENYWPWEIVSDEREDGDEFDVGSWCKCGK